jgi:hypothetical protein
MSSVSSVGSSGLDQTTLSALLQRIKQSSATSDTSKSSSTASASPQEFLTDELEKQGYSGTSLSDLLSKIQSTVDSLQSSASGQVDPSSIHDAINKVLKDAGVDTDQIDKDLKAQHPHGSSSTGSASSSQNSTSNTDTLLSELGVDPKQFQAALQNALQNVNSDGTLDLSKLFASAGTGSQLNVLA